MKAPTPLFLLLLFAAGIYVGLTAFFPSWRSTGRKRRKQLTKVSGCIHILICLPGLVYTIYVLYIFCGGASHLLPLTNEQLFRSADALLLAVIVVPIIVGAFVRLRSSLRGRTAGR